MPCFFKKILHGKRKLNISFFLNHGNGDSVSPICVIFFKNVYLAMKTMAFYNVLFLNILRNPPKNIYIFLGGFLNLFTNHTLKNKFIKKIIENSTLQKAVIFCFAFSLSRHFIWAIKLKKNSFSSSYGGTLMILVCSEFMNMPKNWEIYS